MIGPVGRIRGGLIVGSVLCALAAAPVLGAESGAQLWTALGGNVVCGIAIHPPNSPPMQLLCSSPVVPTPKQGFGDGGNVFLGSDGRPKLERLSQDSFEGDHQVKLRSGTRWSVGPIFLFCDVKASAVRCENQQHHGFTITRHFYHAF
jgi:hypothetical protein